MSAITAISAWFTHPMVIERLTGRTAGGSTYSAATTELGFVDPGNRQVMTPAGEVVTSSARALLPATTADVPLGSRVTLPASFGGRPAVVVSSFTRSSALGTPDHVELGLQ